jgi:hypothetical protein
MLMLGGSSKKREDKNSAKKNAFKLLLESSDLKEKLVEDNL